ncbi:hypothetical protein ACPU8O_002739 [Escherichia coli]|nr:hypothetical protein [Klebsiella pneumoniae]HCA3824479.1 hypothetical protein [Klebsiella pneumoniae]HCM3208360.1 hypothetical protein [Klebsiella pneumoniae]
MTTDITELAKAAEKYRSTLEAHRNNPRDGVALNAWDDATSKFMELVDNDELNIISGLLEALEKAKGMEAYWKTQCRGITDHCEELQARIAELESQVKFPGVMRCNTCGFSRTHIIATPDGMRAGKSEPENCPNGCGPMWHDTYRRQYDELYDAYTALRESNAQVIHARDHYKRMSEEGLKQLAESRTVTVKLPPKIERNDADGWFMYNGGRVGGGAAEWYNKALDDVISAQPTFVTVKPPEPYAYLRENDGQIQISIGAERPSDRSGGYATPWFAIYTAAGIKGKAE